MSQCAAEIDGFEERLWRRHADEVAGHVIVGLVAADADVRPGGADQLLELRQDETGVGWRARGNDVVGQAIALLDVEHGEAFEERDGAGRRAIVMRPSALVVGDEAVGIDDGGPALALADVASKRAGLPESQPALRGIALLDDGVPQDEDIHAAVGPAGGGIPGQSKRRAHARRAPRLNPGQSPGLQLGYDLVGDPRKACCDLWPGARREPAGKRIEPWVTSMTGRREATLPTLDTRHGDSRQTLTRRGFGRWCGARRNVIDMLGTAGIDAHTSWSAPWDRNPNGPRLAARRGSGARAIRARALGPGRGRMAAGRQKPAAVRPLWHSCQGCAAGESGYPP